MEASLIIFIGLIIGAYVVGAIPTGAWFARLWCGIDITQHGSGNIGASNIGRVLGKKFFIPIFLFDAGKAYAVLSLGAQLITPDQFMLFVYCASAALLIGNAFSVFLNFRGGKGVAVILGILLYVLPAFIWVFMVTWLLVLVLLRKPFVASLSAMCTTVIIVAACGAAYVQLLLCMLAWTLFTHRANR